MVHDTLQHARRLPALSDAKRQRDYDQVCRSWECLGMRYVPEAEFQDALNLTIHGYFAEGATQFQVQTLEQAVVMLSFFNSRGWRPVRFARARDGGFYFYGQVCMYRYLGDNKPMRGGPQLRESASQRPAAAPRTPAKQLEPAHPAFRLKAGTGKDVVIGLLGEDYRSTTARASFESRAGKTPGVVDIIDPSILEDEYWLFSKQGHYIEIVFRSGSLLSAELKRRNTDRSEILIARIDQAGLAAVDPYRTVLCAKEL